jgi:hypothetical protein
MLQMSKRGLPTPNAKVMDNSFCYAEMQRCSVLPSKEGVRVTFPTSHSGQQRTFRDVCATSALPR